ncbi:ABC transporter permease [Flavobacterium psychrophilum]|nr:ABC transporter permease [Flavobacterium psychrophilum]
MKNILQLIAREFKLFFGNKILRMLFIGAPVMYGFLVGSVYEKGKVTNLPIVVVDEDQSAMSQKLIQMFSENEVLKIVNVLNNTNQSRTVALKRDAPCVVVIPRDFESQILQKHYPELVVFVDASNTLTANFASSNINLCVATLKAGIQIEGLKKQGLSQKIAETQYEPFKTTFIKENIRSGNYLYFMLPGVLLTVFQQVLLLGLALSFSSEFENNTFKDLVKKMSNPFGLIFVKVIPYLLMSMGILWLYYGFSVYYRLPLHTDWFPFASATFLFVFSVCCIGILGSILLPNQLKATEVLMVVATPSFILSGFTWPLSQMPIWVQNIANAIPLTHYLKIYRILFVEKGDFTKIVNPLWAMLIIGMVCFSLATVFLHLKIRKLKRNN